jgi:hypothetical protein
MWALKLLHRALKQTQQVQRRVGGLLPAPVVADWQRQLCGYVLDVFDKARLALRLSFQVENTFYREQIL